jgi:nucleoside-diphosphate-sugar epimerase
MAAKRVLVIGGTGHIGSYLVPALVADGYDVTVVARGRTAPYTPDGPWSQVRFLEFDRPRDEAAGTWADRLRQVTAEIVVDLIAFEPESTRLLYRLFQGRLEHFLHCGTCWEYGVVRQMPVPEDHPLSGMNAYARKKVAIRRFLLEKYAQEGFPATILAPTQITAHGKPAINPWGDWNDAVWQRLAAGGRFPMPGDGNTPLMHIHASDCARGFLAAIRHREEAVGQAFNLGPAHALTYNGLAEAGARFFGVDLELVHLPVAAFEAEYGPLSELSREMLAQPVCVDIQKLRALGYVPAYTPEAAVREALTWSVQAGAIRKGTV